MSQKHVQFLGNINHDNWAGYVGTMLLLSFGPESRRQLRAQNDTLNTLPILKGLELDSSELIDFTVRQVLISTTASDELDGLSEQAKEADNPVPVPPHLLAELLALSEEQDELLINHLPLYRPGRLEVSVGLSDMFQGRSFGMDGHIDLDRLAEPAESEEVAAAPTGPHAHFLGAIADKSWQKKPGSSILISLGPIARAAVAAAAQVLQQQPELDALDLVGEELSDFSVRQVTVDGMDRLSGGVVGRLEKEARKSTTGPIALPGDKMRHVLLLTDEYDELRCSRLDVTPAGTLEISVALELDGGQAFVVTGGIDLKKLAAEYPD